MTRTINHTTVNTFSKIDFRFLVYLKRVREITIFQFVCRINLCDTHASVNVVTSTFFRNYIAFRHYSFEREFKTEAGKLGLTSGCMLTTVETKLASFSIERSCRYIAVLQNNVCIKSVHKSR